VTDPLTPEADNAEPGIYLYCLARPECLASTFFSAPEERMAGVDVQFPVTAMHLDKIGLVAVISQVILSDFSDSNLQDLTWLGPRARTHESVVQEVMQFSPVLPVKFGTIYRSNTGLADFINHNGAVILQALHQVHGKAEWSVKAYIDEARARVFVTENNPEVQELTARLSVSPGLRYMQQKQVDLRVETALSGWASEVAGTIEEILAPHAVGISSLKLHSSAMSGRSERMIYNGGFLLDNSNTDHFENVIHQLQGRYESSGLILELMGPWPPYHFCPSLSAN
jgi:hypothetical protein